MSICEYCEKEHDGSYGSGRFCSKNCVCAFNASKGKGHHVGQVAWNKGLNKKTYNRIKIGSERLSKTIRKRFEEGVFDRPNIPFCKQYWTKERRKAFSDKKETVI